MSSANRRPSRQEQAKTKAADLRAQRGIDAESTAQTLLSSKKLLKVFKPSTEHLLKAELGRFETFVNDHLLTEDAGKAAWQDWARGRSFDDLIGSEDGSAPPFTVGMMQAFARWRAAGMRGKIRERPALDSVLQAVDVLWCAYSRKTRTSATQDHSVLTSAHAFCSTTLKDELNLHQESRPRRVPDREVLIDVIAAVFSPDLVNEFNAFRLYTLLVMNLQVASASRAGAILRSSSYSAPEYAARAIQWRHCEFWIHAPVSTRDRHNMVQVRFKLEYTKTSTGQQRSYNLYDADIPAFYGASILLTMGVADGVFEGNPTLSWLLDPELLEGRKTRLLPIKKEWLNEPLFRQSAPEPRVRGRDGHSGTLTDYQALGQAWRSVKYTQVLADACHKAGYPVSFASHDIRVLAVTAALDNPDLRLEEVQYSIGHSILSDKWTKYLNNTATIDFQAAILGEGTTYEKLRKMSYMHCEKDPNLPTYLSPKSKDAVFNDDELCHIVLDQREVRRKLRDKESLSPDEILNLELQARNLYLDYKAKEAVVYKNVMRAEVMAHLAKTKALPAQTAKVLKNLEAVEIDHQVDALPDGALVGYDLDMTTAVIASTDFSSPDAIVRLLSAGSSLEDTFQLFQSAAKDPSAVNTATTVSPASTSASTSATASSSRTRTSLKATSSQVLMPPPSVPVQAQGKIATPYSSGVTTPTAGTTTVHAGATGLVQPRVKAKKVAESRVALAAENRYRSASVTSATSAASSSANSSAISAIDSTYNESVAYSLDRVASMLFNPGADRLEFVEALLSLPPKSSHATGWWPGMTSKVVDGEHHCPRCSISLTELVKGLKLYVLAGKLSKMKQHIFKCTQAHMKEAAMPSVIASYNQAQACPICIAHQANAEEDVDLPNGVRHPKQWYDHLRVSHREGDLCMCGHTIGDPVKDGLVHLAREHDIYSSTLGPNLATTPISPELFPLPPLSLRDNHFYPDPREWESHQQREYELVVGNPDLLPAGHAWGARTDLTVRTADRAKFDAVVAEIDAVSPQLSSETVQDGRFQMVVLDTPAKVVSKYGYCIFCVEDVSETFTNRMTTFSHLATHRKHIAAHALNMITGREVLEHVSRQWVAPDAPDDDGADGEVQDATTNSWRDLRFRCPDHLCHHRFSTLSLRQLLNHIYIHHRGYHPGTLGATCIASSDDELVQNLRKLFANCSMQTLANNAGFPLKDSQGLEMLAVGRQSKRKPVSSDEESDDEDVRRSKSASKKIKRNRAKETSLRGSGRNAKIAGIRPTKIPVKPKARGSKAKSKGKAKAVTEDESEAEATSVDSESE